MLGNAAASAVIPVKDLEAGKKFYQDTLGLKPANESKGGIEFEAGKGSKVFVYATEFAGTNKATAIGFVVDNVEETASGLKAKGVSFEHYDMPGVTRAEGSDVHEMGPLKAVWFKDPDGNIISITNQMG